MIVVASSFASLHNMSVRFSNLNSCEGGREKARRHEMNHKRIVSRRFRIEIVYDLVQGAVNRNDHLPAPLMRLLTQQNSSHEKLLGRDIVHLKHLRRVVQQVGELDLEVDELIELVIERDLLHGRPDQLGWLVGE